MQFSTTHSSAATGTTALLIVVLLSFVPQLNALALGPLVFEDSFGATLNRTVWNTYITDDAGGGWPWNMQNSQGVPSSAVGRAGGFNADYDLPSLIDCGVPNVGLELNDIQGSTATGYTWSGSTISSYPNDRYFNTTGFTFSSGYVEVRAKMPSGLADGVWPGIWFLPGPGSHGGEIDLFEGGFKDATVPYNQVMATTLHYVDGASSQVLTNTGKDLTAGYHTYALGYSSGKSIRAYFDGKLVASWTKKVFTGSYYIIISNTEANSTASDWRSSIDGSTPASGSMDVKYVRVYGL